MKITKFEEIIAWQKAQDLAVKVYNQFGKMSDFGFKDQICRAAVSISNNIAEGFDRHGDKEFSRFLYIALGSSSEVRSMSHLAGRLGYLSETEKTTFLDHCDEVSRLIRGFIRSISQSNHTTPDRLTTPD